MDNRRLFIAFLLSLIVLIGWYAIFPPPSAKPPAEPGRPEAAREEPVPAPGTPAGPAAPPPSSPTVPPPAPEDVPRVEAAAEQRVVLQAEGRRAIFTNRGAQLVSLEVREKVADGEQVLDLVRSRAEGPYPYGLLTADLGPHPLNQALFSVEKGGDGRSAVFRYSGPAGRAEKRFRFDERGLLEAQIELPGANGDGWRVLAGPGIRNPTDAELKSRFERRSAVFKAADEVTVLNAADAGEAVEIPGGGLSWAGLEDTYFLSAVIPREGLERAVLRPVFVQPGGKQGASFIPVPPKEEITDEQKDLVREYQLVLDPAADRLSLLSYWGTKEYNRLKALPFGLEDTLDLGMFWFIALPLLSGLHWIYDNLVANYGWAIVLMTVLIRILLLPLTHRSTVSMKKMQELNPKITAIREKYRTKLRDKQGKPNLEMQNKMNQEIMGLYKSEGVNPAGGCLPLLLQMPILFAFYNLLSTAVELRGAPWALWIRDLAVQDPYYVLPIVMGATQFLQVRLAPQAGDPMQRRIFQLMPIFMTFLFLGFPSGLVLYWLTNNILTIVQQAVYNRLQKKEG